MWLLALVIAVVLIAVLLGDAVTTDDYFTNEPESDRADDLLAEREFDCGPTMSEIVIVRSHSSSTVDDAEYKDFVEALFSDLKALGEDVVHGGAHYYMTGDESLVSEDRRTTIIPFSWVDDIDLVHEIVDEADASGGSELQVLITGQETFDKDFIEISQEDLGVEFLVGIPAAIVIMVLVFGALLVTVVPVVLALVSIVMAIGATALVGQVFDFSFFVTNVIAMIGLAVGVDYSLFIVARYREERRRGLDKMEAISVAGFTATRSVLFSGITVVVALIGMLNIPYSIFRSVAAGAIFVTIAAVLASLTLLPAVISIMGDKINALRVPIVGFKQRGDSPGGGGMWPRIARLVMRPPIISFVAAASIMIAASVAYFDINLGFPSLSTFLDDARSKQGFLVLEEDFSFGLVEPTRIVIDGDVESEPVRNAIQSLLVRIEDDSVFHGFDVTSEPEKRLAVITTSIGGDPPEKESVEAIHRLRDNYIPEAFSGVAAQALTAGEAAGNVDFFELAARPRNGVGERLGV